MGGVESTGARGEVGDHGGQGDRWRERSVREGEAWSARGGVGEHGGQEWGIGGEHGWRGYLLGFVGGVVIARFTVTMTCSNN